MQNQFIDDSYIRSFFCIGNEESDNEEVRRIQESFERLVYEHGDNIINIDEEPDYMYFLESGVASVHDREDKQINIMRRGHYFGEYGVLTGERRLSTVRAAGKVVVFRIHKDAMMEIIAKHPGLYGELMKRLYGQLSNKHSQLLDIMRTKRGVLSDSSNKKPLSPKQMIIQYGGLAVIFALTALLCVVDPTKVPIFGLPLALMIAYALYTKRTLESLIAAGFMAAVLLGRFSFLSVYTDALMGTMADMGNVFTVLVMALMGAFVTLIQASGALTAFKKFITSKIDSKQHALLGMLLIMLITAVDDCLNLLCASTSVRTAADRNRLSREESALMYSFLPTTLCSFIPISLWSIYVVANINTGVKGEELTLFCRSIPFNFYSIAAVLAMLLLCAGKLPASKILKAGRKRVEDGGNIWPEGSEQYLYKDEDDMHGKIRNLMLPIVVLAIASFAVRTISGGIFAVDSACGLVAALLCMFILFCGQGLMSPEQFIDHVISGVQSMVLSIVLYLVTMCFSSLLTSLSMEYYFDEIALEFTAFRWLLPAIIFAVAMLLTTLLGSSWAMFVLGFPMAISICTSFAVNLPLCVGAVCAAGIAGEKNCAITAESLMVATAIGCNPDTILKLRLRYSAAFSAIAFFAYILAGYLMA